MIFITLGPVLLIGFEPDATAIESLAVTGLFALFSFALIWLVVALGMPGGLRWFAEYQPFTPITETVRGLLPEREIGNSGGISVAWCVGIALAGYLWAKRLYNRDPSASGRSYSMVTSAA